MEPSYSDPGLPPESTLQRYRIWDAYFTPAHSHPGRDGIGRLRTDVERSLSAMRKARFERACYFAHVGIGTTTDDELEQTLRREPERILAPLGEWPDFLMAMVQINANDLPRSIAAIERWIGNGPMVGIYLTGSGPGARTCNDRNLHPLIERASELNAVIMVHTWFKAGGKDGPGQSTPTDLAELASEFPEQTFVCAHAGGEWERGIRAIRHLPNVLIETSGFDPTAGFIEMAVREVGARRILFGSHLPSRSLGTELGKVIAAEITEAEKCLILGENFRRLLAG